MSSLYTRKSFSPASSSSASPSSSSVASTSQPSHQALDSKLPSPEGIVLEKFTALLHCLAPSGQFFTLLQTLLEGKPISESGYKDITKEQASLVFSFIHRDIVSDTAGSIVNIKHNREAIFKFLDHILKKGFISSKEKEKIVGESGEIPLELKVKPPTIDAMSNRIRGMARFLRACSELSLNFFAEEEISKKAFHLITAVSKVYSSHDVFRFLVWMNPSKNFDTITVQSPEVIYSFLDLLNSVQDEYPEKTLNLLTASHSRFSCLLAKHQSGEVVGKFLALMENLLAQELNQKNREKFIHSLRSFGFPVMERQENNIKYRFLKLLATLAVHNKEDVLNYLKQPFEIYPNVSTVVASQDEVTVKIKFLQLLYGLCPPSQLTPFLLADYGTTEKEMTMFNQLIHKKDGATLFALIKNGFIDGSFTYNHFGHVMIRKTKSAGRTPIISLNNEKTSSSKVSDGYQWLEQHCEPADLEQALSTILSYVKSKNSATVRDWYLKDGRLVKFFTVCEKVLGKKKIDEFFQDILEEKIRLNSAGFSKSSIDWKEKKFLALPKVEDFSTHLPLITHSPDSKEDSPQDPEKLKNLFLVLFEAASAGDEDFYNRFFKKFPDHYWQKIEEIVFDFISLGCIPEKAYKYIGNDKCLGKERIDSLLKMAKKFENKSPHLKTFISWVTTNQDHASTYSTGDQSIPLLIRSYNSVINIDRITAFLEVPSVPMRFNLFANETMSNASLNLIGHLSATRAFEPSKFAKLFKVMVCFPGDFSTITTQSPMLSHRFLTLLDNMAKKDHACILSILRSLRSEVGIFSYELANNCPEEVVGLFLNVMNNLRALSKKDPNCYICITRILEHCGFPIMLKHSDVIKNKFLDLTYALADIDPVEGCLKDMKVKGMVLHKEDQIESTPADAKTKNTELSDLLKNEIYQLLTKPYPEKNNLNLAWAVGYQDNLDVKEKFFNLIYALGLNITPFVLPHFLLKYKNIHGQNVETSFRKKTVFNVLADKNDGKTLVALLERGLLKKKFDVDDQGFSVCHLKLISAHLFETKMVRLTLLDQARRKSINGYDWLAQYDTDTLNKAKGAIYNYLLGLKTSKRKFELLQGACDSNMNLGKLFALKTGFLQPSKDRGRLKELHDALAQLTADFTSIPRDPKDSLPPTATGPGFFSSSQSSSSISTSSMGSTPPIPRPT